MKKETIEKGVKILKELDIINDRIKQFEDIQKKTFLIAFHEETHKTYYPIFEIKKIDNGDYNEINFPSTKEFFDFWKSKLINKKKSLEKDLKNLKD